jgi:hypothetical protein
MDFSIQMKPDPYMLAAALLLLCLFATLRLCLGRSIEQIANPILKFLTAPVWLLPLLLAFNFTVGMYFFKLLSPWPPLAYAQMAARYGSWAGVTAFLAVLTCNLWLLWVPTQVLRRYTAPARRAALKYFPIFNFVAGSVVIVTALLI